jgi:aspartate aminotransferase
MDHLLSNRVNNLAESATIAMSRKSRELSEQGIKVVNLSLGEPDFNTPDFVKNAGIDAINNNFSKYPPVPGYKDLREAISTKFKRDNNIDYTSEQIVVSTGAKQSIMNAVLALVNDGDEVLLPAPYWVSYYEMVRFAGGIPVVLPTTIEDGFKLQPEALKSAISPRTKLMIFSYPCNPSGASYTKPELEEIAKVIDEKGEFMIIADEIYEHINFFGEHTSLASLPGIYDKTITVNGVSKGFAMTGWRIGYIGAPDWVAAACTKIQGQFTSGASSIAQKAAKAAVLADPKEIEFMKTAFEKRRRLFKVGLDSLPGFKTNLPEGAFYMFPDVSELFGKKTDNFEINNADDLSMYFLTEAHVATVSGGAFGSPNNLRLSYATSEEELNEAISRMQKALAKLK